MSSNTNIGNTPVNQGYVQLIHTGETGGIDGTLRTLYDGDGTASDLQIASNAVKVSTTLYIGSDTIQEYIQDTVGAMLVTNANHTNLSATYDDNGDGAIDLTATGSITGITGGTGIDASGSGNITIAIDSTVATLTGSQTLTNKTLTAPTLTGTTSGASLTLSGDLTVNGTTTTVNQTNLDVSDNIIGLNRGASSNANDSGLIIERGSTGDNAAIIWDESADKFTVGTTTSTPSATGDITIVTGTLVANLEGNVTGNVTGSASLNLLKSSNLSDLANAATARSNLGVDAAGTDNSTDVTLAGSLDYLTISGQQITRNAINLGTDVTSTLPVANGGTGASGAAAARTQLGLVIGTDIQAQDDLLQDIADFSTSSPSNDGKVVTYQDSDGSLVLSDKLSPNGSTANGLLTYNTATIADVESNLLFDTSYISIKGSDPSSTYGSTERLRMQRGGNATDRQFQIFETRNGGSRHFDLAFNTDITSSGTGWVYTQGAYGGSSMIRFHSSGQTEFYNDEGIAGSTPTAITPTASLTLQNDNDAVFGGDLYVPNVIYHTGDTNTYIHFTNDRIRLYANGLKIDTDVDYAISSRSISTSGGISGGGDLSADRSLSLSASQLSTVTLTASDQLILFDNSDSDNPKRFIAQDIFDTISGAVTSYTNTGDNRVLTSGGGTTINGESNLTFSGGVLSIDNDDVNEGGQINLLPGTGHTSTYHIDNFYGHLRFFSSATAGEQFRLTSTGNLAQLTGTKHYFNGDGGNTYIDEVASGQLRLVAGGTEAMKFYSSGAIDMYGGSTTSRSINIGANRSGNGYSFIDLVGDATYTDYGARFIRSNGGANTSSEIAHRGTGVLALRAIDAGSVRFYTSNTERVRIDSSGNIGVGNIAPNEKLQINSNTTYDTKIRLGDNGTSRYFLAGMFDSNTGMIGYVNGSPSNLAFHTGTGATGSEKMRIDTSGNVGIGVAPTRPLQIGFTTTNGEAIKLDGNASYGATIYYTRGGSYNWNAGVGGASSSSSNIPASYWGIEDVSQSNAVRLSIAHTTGNIGIGVNTPAHKLEVNGNAKASRLFANDGSAGYASFAFADDQDTGMYSPAQGSIGFQNNGSQRMQLNSVGSLKLDTGGLHDQIANGQKRIVMPKGGASIQNGSSETGAIKIVLPVLSNNTMISMRIRVFIYAQSGTQGKSFDVVCGGYPYQDGNWYNQYGWIMGAGDHDLNYKIRFGRDANNSIIYIGELNSTWAYPQIYVLDVQTGHTGYSDSDWHNAFSIGFESSAFSNLDSTILQGNIQRNVFSRNFTSAYYNIGSVGIGTNSPSKKFHLKDSANEIMFIESTDANADIIGADTGGSTRFRSASGQFQFYTGGSASSSNASGASFAGCWRDEKFGIGTSNPQSPLNINSTDTDQIYLQGSGITSTSIVASDTGGSTRTRSAGGKFEVYTGGSANSNSASGASVRLQIEEDGDIRMVVPDDKRVYFGANNSASIRASSAGYTLLDNADGNFYIRNTVSNQNIYFGINDAGTTNYPMTVHGSSSNIGIGTTGPTSKLHVSTGTNISMDASGNGQVKVEGSGYSLGIALNGSGAHIYHNSSSRFLSLGTNETEQCRLTTGGAWHVKDDVVAFSTTPSDQKLKTNIKDIEYGLDTIMKLDPKQYDWKKDNRHDIGFIAQEVEQVIPEIVKDNEWFDDKIKTLDYEKLTAVLIKAVQEQQEQINRLEEKLNG